MEKKEFWSWVREWLRPRRRGSGDELPPVGDDGLLAGGPDGPGDNEDDAPPAPERGLSRWSRRDQVLQQLQEGYQRVTELIDSMQRHLAEQGQRTDQIAAALNDLARSLPTVGQQQVQTLEVISSHLAVTNSRTQQLAESIRELPGVTKAQTEALTGLSRQFELANETTVQMNHALQSLGQMVESLRKSGQEQADAYRRTQQEGREREIRLAELVVQQQRRFTLLFIITLILALVGAAAGMTVILLRAVGR